MTTVRSGERRGHAGMAWALLRSVCLGAVFTAFGVEGYLNQGGFTRCQYGSISFLEKRSHSGAWGSAGRKFCSQPLHRRRRTRAVQQYRTTMELSPAEFMPFDIVDTVDIMNNVATAAGGVAAGTGGFIDGAQLGALPSIVDAVTADSAATSVAAAASVAARAIPDEMKVDPFDAAGRDLLIFLGATSAVVPLCRKINISPVLGFLAAGVILGPAGFGVFADLGVDNKVGEIGILFLLFEQGLELSLKRLRALAKYAFGLGLLQIAFCTAAFTLFPFLGGVELLETVFGSAADLVDIRRADESLVVGASLALSSSAFVLKLLQEKGQLTERVGSASLGILLMQDITVVPLLVGLPLIVQEQIADSTDAATLESLATSAVAALGGLAFLTWAGRYVLRVIFDIVASARSSETFVALCLLVVLGCGALTDALGLSSTLGAFLAGTLLAETNYRTLVEADIQPFRGLLLGLFFMTTGASVDPGLVKENLPTCLALLGGLITFKAVIITGLGRVFRLSWGECVRTGLLLSGGGEFAFVVLTLAERLMVIPPGLARLLTAIVVMSMALTPALGFLGDAIADRLTAMGVDEKWGQNYLVSAGADRGALVGMPLLDANAKLDVDDSEFAAANSVVVCGFGPVGQTVASMLVAPEVTAQIETSWVAFDLDPVRVKAARSRQYPVFYGDASQPGVLEAAGVASPRAFVVTYTDDSNNFEAVERLRMAYPGTPILSRARSPLQLYKLDGAGATEVVPEQTEVSLRLGAALLDDVFALSAFDVEEVSTTVRASLKERAMQQGKQLAEESEASKAASAAAGGGVSTADYMRQLLAGNAPQAGLAALSSVAKPAASASSEDDGSGARSGSDDAADAGSGSSAGLQPKMSELDLIMGAAEDVSTGKVPDASNKRGVKSVLAPARRPTVFNDAPVATTDNRGSISQVARSDQKGGSSEQQR